MGADFCQQGWQFIPLVLNNDIDAAAAKKSFPLFASSKQVNLSKLRQLIDCLQQQALTFSFLYSSRDHQPQFAVRPVTGQHLAVSRQRWKAVWNNFDVDVIPTRVQSTQQISSRTAGCCDLDATRDDGLKPVVTQNLPCRCIPFTEIR